MFNFERFEECYNQYWRNESELIIMPFTRRAKPFLKKVLKDINVQLILDNNVEFDGEKFENVSIKYAPNFFNNITTKGKILILNHYKEVSKQLDTLGYEEYHDYMDINMYLRMRYWIDRKEVHVSEVHMAITTFCSLNCANCNMFINHYTKEQKEIMSLEEFQTNFQLFLKKFLFVIEYYFWVVNHC